MHYSREHLKKHAPKVSEIFKKYGVKGSIKIRSDQEVLVIITEGRVDFSSFFNNYAFFGGYYEVSFFPYLKNEDDCEGKRLFIEIYHAINEGNTYEAEDIADFNEESAWRWNISVGDTYNGIKYRQYTAIETLKAMDAA